MAHKMLTININMQSTQKHNTSTTIEDGAQFSDKTLSEKSELAEWLKSYKRAE